MTFRALKRVELLPGEAAHAGCGEPPDFRWIELSKLVVDTRYQREIGDKGRRIIRRIVREFDWGRFAPLQVAPLDDGRFAIVDGQHRATAALTHPQIQKVPCLVKERSLAEQARAFIAVNTVMTRATALQVHRAACAVGDPDALRLEKICASAGVSLAPYPKARGQRAPGETLAIGTIQRVLKNHGDRRTKLVLTALRAQDTDGNLVNADTVRALAEAVADRPRLMAGDADYLRLMQAVPIERLWDEADLRRRAEGKTAAAHLKALLLEAMDECAAGPERVAV